MRGRWEETLHSVYPYHMPTPKEAAPEVRWDGGMVIAASEKFAKPRVLIPVFPGTNCEYDVARVFAMEGAAPEIFSGAQTVPPLKSRSRPTPSPS